VGCRIRSAEIGQRAEPCQSGRRYRVKYRGGRTFTARGLRAAATRCGAAESAWGFRGRFELIHFRRFLDPSHDADRRRPQPSRPSHLACAPVPCATPSCATGAPFATPPRRPPTAPPTTTCHPDRSSYPSESEGGPPMTSDLPGGSRSETTGPWSRHRDCRAAA